MSSCGSMELSQKLTVSWVTLTRGFSLLLGQCHTWEWPHTARASAPCSVSEAWWVHPFFLSIT